MALLFNFASIFICDKNLLYGTVYGQIFRGKLLQLSQILAISQKFYSVYFALRKFYDVLTSKIQVLLKLNLLPLL